MRPSQRWCTVKSRLDALVACAGMGLAGSLEDTDDDEARRQFDTNFFGTTRTIRAVLPVMRKQSSGKILVIGSIGGLIGLPFVAYYSASKFALDGLVEALRGEVAPFGIQATIVHPGDINTAFGANRVLAAMSVTRRPTRLASRIRCGSMQPRSRTVHRRTCWRARCRSCSRSDRCPHALSSARR